MLLQSPWRSNGPLSLTENMSSAVMRPSFEKPTFIRPRTPGRPRPMKCSSSRLMRIITGAFAFFASSTGMMQRNGAGDLAAESTTGNSLMTTTFSGGTPTHRATPVTVWAVLCVPV